MKLIFSILFIQFTLICYSQYYTVRGRVLDLAGNSVSYATIASAKIHETFSSDKQGLFSFQTPYKYDTLTCTHISYQKQIQVLAENDTINFIMVPNDTFLYSVKGQTNDFEKSSKTENFYLIEKWLKEKEEKQKQEREEMDSLLLNGICVLPMFKTIYVPAKYKDGEEGFESEFKRVYDSLNYPGFKGVMKAGLSIDKKGFVSNIKLIAGINEFVDSAVIKAIEVMHPWQPAIQNGRNVPFNYIVQIEDF